jgi:hypothetical protein
VIRQRPGLGILLPRYWYRVTGTSAMLNSSIPYAVGRTFFPLSAVQLHPPADHPVPSEVLQESRFSPQKPITCISDLLRDGRRQRAHPDQLLEADGTEGPTA